MIPPPTGKELVRRIGPNLWENRRKRRSAKAATHKQVHPYLRYGILIGSWGDTAFPARLFRHGAYFDFMATWDDYEPADEEWHGLVATLILEIKASRKIQQTLSSQRVPGSGRLKMIHRPLNFK